LRESAAKLPETPYGTTKLSCEWILAEYARAYNMGYTALRYFNASGADLDGQNGEDRRVEAHLIPLVFQAALGRRPSIKVCGTDYPTRDGTCVRDYVHVLDLAQAHQRAVETLEPGVARVYNIGSGDGTTVLEVLRTCEEVVGRPIPHELVDRRPGDPAVLVASPQRLADELGWSPRYSEIRTIVETAWRWHQSHPHGYGTRP
jgi:UDP-glucose 4-epimerase